MSFRVLDPTTHCPEIPDSSKWSSNEVAKVIGGVIWDLKYQIPVSGVQTFNAHSQTKKKFIPEIPDSSKWSSNQKISDSSWIEDASA